MREAGERKEEEEEEGGGECAGCKEKGQAPVSRLANTILRYIIL